MPFGGRRWRGRALNGVRQLLWSPRNDRLLVVGARHLTLYGAGGTLLTSRPLPAGMRAEHAAWAPHGAPRVALVRSDSRTTRSELVLLDAADGLRARPLFARLGRFGAPLWSPNGRWLLLPWPAADQWLFLRPQAGAGGRRTAVANIARQFAPGTDGAAFPRSVQWCCP